MIRKFLFAVFLIINFVFIIYPTPAHAQFTIVQPNNGGVKVDYQTGAGLVQTIVSNVITILFTVAGIGALAMFLWGAFEWIVSGGEKEKIAKARGRIVNAIIGLVLIALSFFIIRVVGQIIGFDALNLKLPSFGNFTPSVICDDTAQTFCGPNARCVPNYQGQVINGRRYVCQ